MDEKTVINLLPQEAAIVVHEDLSIDTYFPLEVLTGEEEFDIEEQSPAFALMVAIMALRDPEVSALVVQKMKCPTCDGGGACQGRCDGDTEEN